MLSAGGISLSAGNRKSAQGIYPVKVRRAGRWTQPDLAVPSGKKYDRGFHQWFDESADLNQCYIETRYPADIEREYTYKMVKNFYRMAKEMYQYIFAEIDKEFDCREKAEEDAPFYAR